MLDLYLLDKAFREYVVNKDMRTGQSLMAALGDVDMSLYRKISGTPADCFYSDLAIPAFWDAITRGV
jgi:hypothetical protein